MTKLFICSFSTFLLLCAFIDVVNLTLSATTAIKLGILLVSAAHVVDRDLVRMTEDAVTQDLTHLANVDETTVMIVDIVAQGVTVVIGVMTVTVIAEVAFVVTTAMIGAMIGVMINGAIAVDAMKDAL